MGDELGGGLMKLHAFGAEEKPFSLVVGLLKAFLQKARLLEARQEVVAKRQESIGALSMDELSDCIIRPTYNISTGDCESLYSSKLTPNAALKEFLNTHLSWKEVQVTHHSSSSSLPASELCFVSMCASASRMTTSYGNRGMA